MEREAVVVNIRHFTLYHHTNLILVRLRTPVKAFGTDNIFQPQLKAEDTFFLRLLVPFDILKSRSMDGKSRLRILAATAIRHVLKS